MAKLLFLVQHRKDRSPGQRYRHEQYLDALEAEGFAVTLAPLMKTKEEDEAFYGTRLFPKVWVGLKALFRRVLTVAGAGKYEAVYIYRDAFFFGTFFERWLKRKRIPIIYDFDDAIWLMDENPNQGIFNRLKNPAKTAEICALADTVIVGNDYLREYALQYNPNIVIIPSTIDLSQYVPTPNENGRVCIGWTGSFSTIKHFETVVPALLQIKEKYGDKVFFKLIGDPAYRNQELALQGVVWKSETEVEDLSELDIGIMPLPDNEWTRGKCGMKGLQYMALGIPTILAPVGVNTDIIRDGENGFMASTTEEWVAKLSRLIEDEVLRKKLGYAGRRTVEEGYSVEENKEKWLRVFESLRDKVRD